MAAQPGPDTALQGLAIAARAPSARGRVLRKLRRNVPAMTALAILLVMVLAALFADVIAPHDPTDQNIVNRLRPPAWMPRGLPDHVLGTDRLGRDVLSRLIYGARVSLTLGFLATCGAMIVGVLIGLISGYVGGRADDAIQRATDIWLAFPGLVLLIAAIVVFGTSFAVLLAVLIVDRWVSYAKVTRGQVLSVRRRDYVEAARVIGASPWRIMLIHILPNIVSPIIVIWTFSVATIILTESGLSFLGLGIQPPTPAWGAMLSDGREFLSSAWWLATFPGIAIVLVVLSVNIFGDALRDALDPRLR